MPAELSTTPTPATFRLDALVRLVKNGQMRVPHFQRDFRWTTSDVVDLFDSLLRGFPVGSVLLWSRPAYAGEVRVGALMVDAPDVQQALWVVDGQQRITSLVNALSLDAYEADERFRLDYVLAPADERKRIVAHQDARREPVVPLPTLFDLRRLLAWMQDHPEFSDQVEELNDVASRLRSFELPASVVSDPDPAVLQEIFDRTNSAGKRLKRAEVFSALHAPTEALADESLSFAGIASTVEDLTAFGRVDDDTVLRVVLARRGPDVTRDVRYEFLDGRRRSEFSSEGREDAYARGQDALLLAVRFLQNKTGVPHFSFLPYRYLLVTLARFFAHFPEPHPRNGELLARWYWRAALRGPEIFKGSATGAMRALCNQIAAGDESGSVQRLLTAVDRDHALTSPSTRRFRANEAASKVLLCALWELGPLSIETGERLDTASLAAALEGHASASDVAVEVVPRRAVPVEWAMGAANRIIAVSEDLAVVRDLLRGSLMLGTPDDRTTSEVLESLLVRGEAATALRGNDVVGFLERRDEDLREHLRVFIERRAGVDLASTPPLSDLDLDESASFEGSLW